MESGNSDTVEKKEKEILEKPGKKQKYKLIKNKTKNYIFNLISYIINNKNNFEEKLKPSDLEIILETNSNISTYSQLKYKTKINYGYFNSKRDIIKNIDIYRKFPAEIEIKDEYYKNSFEHILIELFPEIKKKLKLDLVNFPLYSYVNKEIKEYDKNELKSHLECGDNEYIFCIYISYYDSINGRNDPIKMIENIVQSDNFFNYFKFVLIIFQFDSELQLEDFLKDDKLDKYFNNNVNRDKILFLFNFLSCYKNNEKNKDNLINIFQENRKIVEQNFNFSFSENDKKNYFFILDKDKIIVELAPLCLIGNMITFLLLELRNNEKNNEKIPFFVKKEMEEKSQLKQAKKLINFISSIKKLKLDYIFDIYFNISFTLYPNDDFTKIRLKKINFMKFNGTFNKTEYNYLKDCSQSLNLPFCEFSFKENPTIDIEIDFIKMDCEKCKKIIEEESFLYYCYICKNKYCFDCVQSQLNDNKGKKKYIDSKHNLIFFKTRDKKQFLNIDKEKLGTNLFVEYDDEGLHNWTYIVCNGCTYSFEEGTERYLCLTCKKGIRLSSGYIDFCGKCIGKMCKNKKDMENLEKVSDKIIENFDNNYLDDYKLKIEHKHENHIYLMIPHQIEGGERGYYNF